MKSEIATIELKLERDVVLARQRARQISNRLGFDTHDQTRISTAVSEIARDAFNHTGRGSVEFSVDTAEPPTLFIRLSAVGEPRPDSKELGTAASPNASSVGLGFGFVGAQRLMDVCETEPCEQPASRVLLGKHLPKTAPDRKS